MRKLIILLLLFIMNFTVNAQFSPQSKKITNKFFPNSEEVLNTTPALQKKRGYTNYKELIAFLDELVKAYPDIVSLSYIGKSQKKKRSSYSF